MMLFVATMMLTFALFLLPVPLFLLPVPLTISLPLPALCSVVLHYALQVSPAV